MSEVNIDDDNNRNNQLSLEDESLLKDSMVFLQEEYNIKKDQKTLLKQELSETKKKFQSQIQEYQKETNLTIEKEKEIQISLSKISKMKKRRALIIKNSFNKKFYLHLLEISTNPKKEKILKNYFSLILLENNQESRTIKELIQILKNEEEIKQLLYYSYKIYFDLRIKDEKQYYEYKKKFENYLLELKDLDGAEYPFDEMFECLGIIFEIIECEKSIKENNFILNKLIEKKNAKFLEIKNIEQKIKNYYKNIKKIQGHIRIIHSFYDNFKEKSAAHDYNSLKELIDNIEEYKKIDFDYNKINQNFDAISSLTFGTYCTQSEDSSVKSSTLESKNRLKSNNNNNTPNKKTSQFNIFESSNDMKNNNLKNSKSNKKFNNNLKDIKNENKNNTSTKLINNILMNENSKDKKKPQLKDSFKKNNNTINNNNKFLEIKSNNSSNKKNKNVINEEKNKNKDKQIYENKDLQKNENNKNIIEEEKSQTNIKENKIKEEKGKEIIDKKKGENLNFLSLKINQLKSKELNDSTEMIMPKESLNKNYDIVNTEYNFNDNEVCDEMISFNNDVGNMRRSTTNDYINKIGVKNNVVLSQELYKNKYFMRRNNKDFGKLKIEKSIEASNCCASCT